MPTKTHKPTLDQVLARNRLIVAVYLLADDDEPATCYASDQKIMACTGLDARALRHCLRELDSRGEVVACIHPDDANNRILVLMDHPGAGAVLKDMQYNAWKPSWWAERRGAFQSAG